MDNIINEIKLPSPERPAQEVEEEKVDVEARPEGEARLLPDAVLVDSVAAPKVPGYTIMTKRIKQKKVLASEQEHLFAEMIQGGFVSSKEDFKLGTVDP